MGVCGSGTNFWDVLAIVMVCACTLGFVVAIWWHKP